MDIIDRIIQSDGCVILDKQNVLSDIVVSFCDEKYRVVEDKVEIEFMRLSESEETVSVRYRDKIIIYHTPDHKMIFSFDKKKSQYVGSPIDMSYNVSRYVTDAYIILYHYEK